jgi:hypothetical protein
VIDVLGGLTDEQEQPLLDVEHREEADDTDCGKHGAEEDPDPEQAL